MPRRVTLRDIAKRTGFSMATVSSALNNDPRVKGSTRDLVKTAAEEMGYRPDPALLALSAHRWDGRRNKAGMTIAYVTGIPKDPLSMERYEAMVESMKLRAESLGYRFYFYYLRDLGSVESASRILFSRGTSGLLVGPLTDESQMAGFDWDAFSAVAVDLGHYRPPLNLVTNNPLTCVRIAWEKVLAAGHTRIGVVLAPDQRSDFFNEQRAWVSRLQHELPEEFPRIPVLDFTTVRSLRDWCDEHEPDVVIGFNEWLPEALGELGRRVPEDLSFVSLRKEFKHYPSELSHPDIAGLLPHPDHLGQVAVDQVDLLIRRNEKGLPPFNLTLYIDLSWHSGTSLVQRDALAVH